VSAKFVQTNQTVQSQYNAETIYIGSATSVSEMAQSIATLRAQVIALKELPPSVRQEVIEALTEAEKRAPSPDNTNIKSKLDAAGAALSMLDGVTDKTLTLARTLFKIGVWIVAAL
jgi:hypothetical protein